MHFGQICTPLQTQGPGVEAFGRNLNRKESKQLSLGIPKIKLNVKLSLN